MNEQNQQPKPLSIFVQDTIYVSELVIIGIIVERITGTFELQENKTVVSVVEYREILKDTVSTDAQIIKRLQFLEAFCKNIIRLETEKIQVKIMKNKVKS